MKPHILVLGGNFAGLGSALKIREYCWDSVRISVIDRKDYLLFVPNIPWRSSKDGSCQNVANGPSEHPCRG